MGDGADYYTESELDDWKYDEQEIVAPICPYCKGTAALVDSKRVYGKSYGMMWLCPNYPQCDSYVGVHKATNEPLGRMANKELRAAKVAAHAAFDPLWKGKSKSHRSKAYHKLANRLGITREQCHIGLFDVETCRRVVQVCEQKGEVT